MADDSPGDTPVHLANSIGALTSRLAALDSTLSLHIGVATSDLGTTGTDDPAHPGPPLGQVGNGGCAEHGKDGVLLTSGAPVTGNFVIDEPGQRNYTGTLDEVLARMLQVGGGGCGFEQPLAATVRALSHPSNAGFRRDDADLAIILVTDEDDCSFRNPTILSPESPELGPVQSFRCTRFGLTCDESTDELGEKHHCHAKEDSGLVTGIAKHVSAIRAASPRTPVFAAIVGDPTPVIFEQRTPPGGGTAVTSLAHSCTFDGRRPRGRGSGGADRRRRSRHGGPRRPDQRLHGQRSARAR